MIFKSLNSLVKPSKTKSIPDTLSNLLNNLETTFTCTQWKIYIQGEWEIICPNAHDIQFWAGRSKEQGNPSESPVCVAGNQVPESSFAGSSSVHISRKGITSVQSAGLKPVAPIWNMDVLSDSLICCPIAPAPNWCWWYFSNIIPRRTLNISA